MVQNVPELYQNRPDSDSIGPIHAQFWQDYMKSIFKFLRRRPFSV